MPDPGQSVVITATKRWLESGNSFIGTAKARRFRMAMAALLHDTIEDAPEAIGPARVRDAKPPMAL